MSENYSIFKIPAKKQPEAYSYVSVNNFELFDELNAISEEIERCRLENL